jgi:hypothetical protein
VTLNGVIRRAMALGFISLVAADPARGDLQVRVPQVEYRALEFEHDGLITFDAKGSALNRAQSYAHTIGYGLLPWWRIELAGELASGGGQHLTWNAISLENTFQLTEPGEYLFDLGLLVGYSQSTVRGEPNGFAFGPIIQKELNKPFGLDTVHTLNLFLSRDIGRDATRQTGLFYAWQSLVRTHPLISPGIEFYGFIPDITRAGPTTRQQHLVGPVLVGEADLSRFGTLRYEVGYLFGLTPASGRGAIRWLLDYEIVF